MRLGYAIANRQLIERLYSAMQPFPVNGATQVAGIAALSDLTYMQSNVETIKEELKRVSLVLCSLGFRCYPTATNFILAESSGIKKTATEVVTKLKAKGIYVWDCTGSPGAGEYHFRITIGSSNDNTLLLNALSGW
jgi:histidinol-phosphate/aromatic aminotransferase/cobyric acid decarboxylase-like protein